MLKKTIVLASLGMAYVLHRGCHPETSVAYRR